METIADDQILDQRLDLAIENAKAFESFPRIVHAAYHAGPDLELLILLLDNGRRLLIPREELSELNNASPEQILDLHIGPQGRSVWWPQLDDGVYLPDFLEHRWGRAADLLAA